MDQPPTQSSYGQEDEIHLRDIWNLLVRNWLLISFCLIAVVGGTAAYTFNTVPLWESRASIRIDEERSNIPALDILSSIQTGSQVETEMEVLRSRTLAESIVSQLALQVAPVSPKAVSRVVLMHGVYAERWAPEATYLFDREADGATFSVQDIETGADMGTYAIGEPVALPGVTFTLTEDAAEFGTIEVHVEAFERAVSSLQANLTVGRPNREANMVNVRYQSTDTLLVSAVPNLLAFQFIDDRQEVMKTSARSTVTFLNEQIDTLRGQLSRSEEELQAYQEGEQVVSLQAQNDAQATRLIDLQTNRGVVDTERRALQDLLDEIALEDQELGPLDPSPYRRLIAFPALLQNQAVSEMLRSLNQVENDRTQLLQRRLPEDRDVQLLTNEIRRLETQLQNIATTYLQSLANQVESYDQTLTNLGVDLERIPAQQVAIARLRRQIEILDEIYTVLQTRLKEAEVAQAVEDASVRVVDVALRGDEPIKPRKALNLALALVLGTMLGVGIAFIREYMDDTVHTREDVVAATGGAPVLGMIPRIKGAGGQATTGKFRRKASPEDALAHLESRLVTGRDPRNPVAEAYRSLRTNITFSNPEHPPKTIVFTSPIPQDGKSTSAANLSITLAQQGMKVLLIDGDLRRGVLNNVVGLDREPGLTNVLMGQMSPPEAIHQVDLGESGTLHFMATGTLPPNPAELLGSSRMGQLIDALEQVYDLVIIDSAPLTVVTDAAVLGTHADGVILVSRANHTEKGAITYSVEQLNNVRAPILGAILNDVDYRRDGRYSSSYGRYGYYYQYYYGSDDRGKAKKAKG